MAGNGPGKNVGVLRVTLKRTIPFELFTGYLGGEAGLFCEHIARSGLPFGWTGELVLGEISIPRKQANVMGVPEEFLSKFNGHIRTFICLECLSLINFLDKLKHSENFYVLDGLALGSSNPGRQRLNLQSRSYFRT